MRALVAQIRQEANSFNPVRTNLSDFSVRRGDQLLDPNWERGSILRGIVDQLHRDGIDLIPTLAASARPGGPLLDEVFQSFAAEILSAAAGEEPDMVVLDCHGSMITESSTDPEGDLLAELRQTVGETCVIAVGLDLHGHVTDQMLASADIVTAYKHNPHSDYGDRVLGGATGDSVELLECLVNSEFDLTAAIPIVDPTAVDIARRAGRGSLVSLSVGGALYPQFGSMEIEGVVETLTDGRYRLHGPFLAGQETCHGNTAVIRCDRATLILTERAGYSQDIMFFESAGIDIQSFDFVVVKSGNHFQLSFEGRATPLKIDTNGIGAYKPGLFDLSRPPIYPEFDSDNIPLSIGKSQI